MKSFTLTPITIFLLFSSLVWSEELEYGDLVKRNGLIYKKFSEEPFTGNVGGKYRGKILKGKEEGEWTWWWDNGQLYFRNQWKNGKVEGPAEWYYENGQLYLRGHYRDDEKVGKWEYYNKDGTIKEVKDFGE